MPGQSVGFESMRNTLRPLSALSILAGAVLAALVLTLPLITEQQTLATVAALTLAALAAGVSTEVLGSPVLRPALVRARTEHRIPVTVAWSVTQVPRTPARPRAPGGR